MRIDRFSRGTGEVDLLAGAGGLDMDIAQRLDHGTPIAPGSVVADHSHSANSGRYSGAGHQLAEQAAAEEAMFMVTFPFQVQR